MRKNLLNKCRGVKEVNNDIIIPVDINRDYSLFQDERKNETFDLLKLYNDEKDNSTKHRLIFTINPLCTNVLFNYVTEIVYKEGSDKCTVLDGKNSKIEDLNNALGKKNPTRFDAIRNTEYSNDIFNLTYHCGVDIFNNHLLRKKDYSSVQLYNKDNKDKLLDKFNTIEDYYRNSNGDYITVINPYEGNSFTYSGDTNNKNNLQLYSYDTIYSFLNSYLINISKQNGWMGFYNPSTIHIPVSGEVTDSNAYYINKCINNVESCQFIDMAPERDLFYFTPKKNKYRRRLEYNWDYCLTYPAESIYEGFDVLEGIGKGLPIQHVHEYETNNGLPMLLLYSPVKHNLKSGDQVKITYKSVIGKNEYDYEYKCAVVRTGFFNGEQDDRFFSIRKNDLNNNFSLLETKNIRFIKLVNGYECDYYFRKFNKIGQNIKSSINRLAFSNNIFNDEASQLVFTEDLDVNGLKDNLGRPLTEIYLTILKRNKGYKEWYYEQKYKNNIIEFSHVFGEVTSGIDIPNVVNHNDILELNEIPKSQQFKDDENTKPFELIKVDEIYYKWANDSYERFFYNCNTELNLPSIRKQHNIINNIWVPKSSNKIENDINIDSFSSFYGDLVEFNPVTVSETILQPIMHRFNTAQRELEKNSFYSKIYHDEIINESDSGITVDVKPLTYKIGKYVLYNDKNGNNIIPSKAELLTYNADELPVKQIKGYSYVKYKNKYYIWDSEANEDVNNLNPEGYIYYPHHKVKIGKFSDIVKQKNNTKVFLSETPINESKYVLTHKTPTINDTVVEVALLPTIKVENVTYIKHDEQYYVWEPLLKFYTNNNYNLITNDKLIIFNRNKQPILINVYSYLFNKDKNKYEIIGYGDVNILDINDLHYSYDDFFVYKLNKEIPEYAYFMPNTSGIALWKDIIKPSSYLYNDELYSLPFTNGAFYHHQNIIFPIKRQDPFEKFGIRNCIKSNNNFDISPEEVTNELTDGYVIELDNVCF